MNSVTDKKQRRRPIFTKDLMAGIPVLVQQGLSAEAIAARLGCTVGTLKVRCSQAQISLCRPGTPRGRGRGRFIAMRLSSTALDCLRKHAAATGVSVIKLATDLLEMIAQDNLYDAVLDPAKVAA